MLYKSLEERKLVDLRLNENIVVLPPRIWFAFTSWYGPTIEIQRTVIKYRADCRRNEILPS